LPPTISKQSPRPTTIPTRTANGNPGSVLSEAIDVGDIQDDSIHLLLYGRNRIGKTTLACTFPKPLLLVSIEPTRTGGARSVKKVPGVKYLRLETVSRFVELSAELMDDASFKTVVIDSATSLEAVVLAEICGWEKTAELIAVGHTRPGAKVTSDQYVERSERMRKIVRPYLDFPRHLVVTANEKDHNPPEGRKSALSRGLQTESFFAAALGAGTTLWLQDGCDHIGQLYMDKEVRVRENKVGSETILTEEETGRLVRRLRTSYHPNYAAGFRSENPECVPEYIDDPTYEKIAAVVRGDKPKK
jgi:hypothetical protein